MTNFDWNVPCTYSNGTLPRVFDEYWPRWQLVFFRRSPECRNGSSEKICIENVVSHWRVRFSFVGGGRCGGNSTLKVWFNAWVSGGKGEEILTKKKKKTLSLNNTVHTLIITCPVLLCVDNDETCDIVDYQKKFEILNTFEQDSRSEDVSAQFQYYGQCKYDENCGVLMAKYVKSVFSASTTITRCAKHCLVFVFVAKRKIFL